MDVDSLELEEEEATLIVAKEVLCITLEDRTPSMVVVGVLQHLGA